MQIKLSIPVFVLFFFGFMSCDNDVVIERSYYTEDEIAQFGGQLNLTSEPYNYNLSYPKYINTFSSNNTNYDLVTLGRVLFYDTNLSSDKSVSCASCHKQEKAFSDDVAFSLGANGNRTKRNSLALGSVINFSLYYGNSVFNGIPFFWDNSANTVQEQSQKTLANPNEMNMHMSEVKKRVNSLAYYKPLINKAYNSIEASDSQILDAIAVFINSITNYDTKFDEAVSAHFIKTGNTNIQYKKLSNLSIQEDQGKEIYLSNCANCHGILAGRPGKTESNNGLYTVYQDKGIASIKGGTPRFKVPTLRNIMLTAPYMHDGSIATIDDVLDHYSLNIKNTEGLDASLKEGGSAIKMNFSVEEKDALKAFLQTLTDEKVITAAKFSDPFIR
jgi:cytochrome c peroxidase